MIKLDDRTLDGALAKNGLNPLYYITGNDEYLLDRCVGRVLKAALGGDAEGLTRLDAAKSTDEEIEQPFYTCSFLGARRVLLFDGFDPGAIGKVRAELFAQLLREIPEDITVVFKQFVPDGRFSVSKKAEAFAANCPDAALVVAAAKKGYALEAYIEGIIKGQGCTARGEVVKRIVELCGDDLMLISGEIAKLAARADYGEITLQHVEALCVRTAEAGVYDMISKIERKDVRGALLALETMLDDRTPPLAITAALNTAFINYYRARLARDKGLSQKTLFDLFDYKSGDRKVGIAYERCARFSAAQLEKMVALLCELDLKLKGSAVDERILIEQYVSRLALAAGGTR